MIGKLLSSAIKLYLRSQVDKVGALDVKIAGKNKQILQGHIPQVFLSCDRAIYQGLHLSQIELKGTDIAVNLPEVLKREPLRLIEPIMVEIKLKLDAENLKASLKSNLFKSGLKDLWQMILIEQNSQDILNSEVTWQSIAIGDRELSLMGSYRDASGIHQLNLSTGIDLANEHILSLSPLNVASESLLDIEGSQLEIDLGTDIKIAKLTIESEHILCTGNIKVNN